jgi:hypothetical protein
LIARRRKSRRYKVTTGVVALLCGKAILHDRAIAPVITIMSRGHKPAALQPNPRPVDQHYEQIRRASVEILRQLGVAA